MTDNNYLCSGYRSTVELLNFGDSQNSYDRSSRQSDWDKLDNWISSGLFREHTIKFSNVEAIDFELYYVRIEVSFILRRQNDLVWSKRKYLITLAAPTDSFSITGQTLTLTREALVEPITEQFMLPLDDSANLGSMFEVKTTAAYRVVDGR